MKTKLEPISLYHEIYGTGKPLIFIHGNGEDHHIFDEIGKKCLTTNSVILVDSRCHGQSRKDVPLHYIDMANDIIKLIEDNSIEKPILIGFSDGGIIALLVALIKETLLDSIVICGTNTNPYGVKTNTFIRLFFSQLFKPSIYKRLMLKEPRIKKDDLIKISIPVHVIAGEKDIIKLKHTKKISLNIKNSTIKIVKDEDHGSYVLDNDKFYEIIKEYI